MTQVSSHGGFSWDLGMKVGSKKTRVPGFLRGETARSYAHWFWVKYERNSRSHRAAEHDKNGEEFLGMHGVDIKATWLCAFCTNVILQQRVLDVSDNWSSLCLIYGRRSKTPCSCTTNRRSVIEVRYFSWFSVSQIIYLLTTSPRRYSRRDIVLPVLCLFIYFLPCLLRCFIATVQHQLN